MAHGHGSRSKVSKVSGEVWGEGASLLRQNTIALWRRVSGFPLVNP
eukprot:SAG31_NODE_545_length_14238_cov_15.518849_1_plen_45_part_10